MLAFFLFLFFTERAEFIQAFPIQPLQMFVPCWDQDSNFLLPSPFRGLIHNPAVFIHNILLSFFVSVSKLSQMLPFHRSSFCRQLSGKTLTILYTSVCTIVHFISFRVQQPSVFFLGFFILQTTLIFSLGSNYCACLHKWAVFTVHVLYVCVFTASLPKQKQQCGLKWEKKEQSNTTQISLKNWWTKNSAMHSLLAAKQSTDPLATTQSTDPSGYKSGNQKKIKNHSTASNSNNYNSSQPYVFHFTTDVKTRTK